MNKLLLNLVLLPSGLWKSMGADTDQLKAILGVKLIMDDRKPFTFGRQQRQNKNAKYTSAVSMVFYFVAGLLYAFPLLSNFNDTVFALWISFSIFLFLLIFTLISDFSSVLVDSRDKYILFHRPVDDRTIFLARMLHIFIYLLRMVLPMSLPSWITIGLLYGWQGALLYPIPLLLMVLMALFFVNAIYLLLLKLARPERFKDIINSFQIVFSIIVFSAYYLMPRALSSVMNNDATIADMGWIRYFPSYWLAATWTWVQPYALLPGTRLLSILAVVFPIVCAWVTVKWLAPSFIKNINAIEGAGEVVAVKKTKQTGRQKLYLRLASLFNKAPAARAGFMITWLQTARSRSFKMRVYPSFAYVPVFFFYNVFSSGKTIEQAWLTLPDTRHYILLMYICSIPIMQALNFVTLSEQYKASWVYYSSPLARPGAILIGAFKAVWAKFLLPFLLIVGVFVLYVWGLHVWIDIVLAFVNITLLALCIMRIAYRYFPFSQPEEMNNSANRTMRTVFAMIIPLSLGFAHYMVLSILWLKLLFLVLSCILIWLIWDSLAKTSWAQVEFAD